MRQIHLNHIKLLTIIILIMTALNTNAENRIYAQNIKTLQVIVNQDWLSPPVMKLNSNDVLNVSFDEMSHDYHRFIYKIEHCEADWSVSQEIFESDYLEGFNNNPIDDYQNSINTTILYTHYKLQIPNEKCRLKISGNYILTVYDEDNDNKKILTAKFMVVEPRMDVNMSISTNTDIDLNKEHQQVAMKVNYGNLNITNVPEQIQTVVMQNNNIESSRINVKPNIINNKGLEWSHNKELIFEAGNEYRKYEILALSHPTMGIENITWDGNYYNVYPNVSESRNNYLYDEDANGAFYIRNSDNIDNDFTCDYVFVHYKLKSKELPNSIISINGQWTTNSDSSKYQMTYNHLEESYTAIILQKQGYYSYRFVNINPNGKVSIPPTEGNFYQTENRYQAYVYYKGVGERTWRLVGYKQTDFRSDNLPNVF